MINHKNHHNKKPTSHEENPKENVKDVPETNLSKDISNEENHIENPTKSSVVENKTKEPKSFKTLSIFLCLCLILSMLVMMFVITKSSEKDTRFKVLEDKFNAQQKEIASNSNLQSQISDLENQLKQNKNFIIEKTKGLNEAGTKVLQYEADLSAKNDKIKELEDSAKTLTTQNSTLSTENTSIKQELASIKNKVGTILGIKN